MECCYCVDTISLCITSTDCVHLCSSVHTIALVTQKLPEVQFSLPLNAQIHIFISSYPYSKRKGSRKVKHLYICTTAAVTHCMKCHL